MVSVLFSTADGFVPYVIKRVTWSDWTHVAVRVGEWVYESAHDTGVVKLPFAEWLGKHDGVYREIDLPGFDADEVRSILESRVGNQYDWLGGVVAQLLFIRRQHDDKDHCAELPGMALRDLFDLRDDELHTLTPRRVCAAAYAYNQGFKRCRALAG